MKKRTIKVALFSTTVLLGLAFSIASSNKFASATTSSATYAKSALTDEEAAATNNNFATFDKTWAYSGTDLGFTYSKTSTTFKVWAPTATAVQLISYGTNTSPTAPQVSATAMTRGTSANPTNHAKNTIGVWTLTVPKNESGIVYAYKLTFGNGTVSDYPGTPGKPAYGTLTAKSVTTTTNDPYSIATTQGGTRSVVEAPSSITSNLTVAQGSKATWRVTSPTQAIVDELHVREFTLSKTSGVSTANQGKYLGLIQTGTKDPNTGTATGLDYLKQEGFNYVQLMPSSQYASVNESGKATTAQPNVYNWGYDPENEMVPEGEYASNSINPATRINEMKQMVQGLHKNGIGVIMDMVLNHVYSQSASAFENTEPGYYFRKYTESGCGNDTASDHEMFGNFIVNSVLYWAKNYDIDGFRFDEMSLLDNATMNRLRSALTALDPHIMMYGEGWVMGNPNGVAETDTNSFAKVPGIGFFNAGIRDNIRGHGETAYVDGNTSQSVMTSVADGILASGGWNGNSSLESFLTPSQSVNYVECHDDKDLNDQLWSNDPNDDTATHQARVALANAVNIMADGITFMEAGQEFDQSKLVNPDGTATTPQALASTAWNSASWAVAGNSYNGLMGENADGTYYGNIGNFSHPTMYYVGDAADEINWDNVKANQADDNFIAQIMKFKKANPTIWPNDYSKIFSDNSPLKVTNSTNGVITLILTNGTAQYLVVFNASGNSVTVGQNGGYYTSSLANTTVVTSDDANLKANQILGESVTLSNLTGTIIQLTK